MLWEFRERRRTKWRSCEREECPERGVVRWTPPGRCARCGHELGTAEAKKRIEAAVARSAEARIELAGGRPGMPERETNRQASA